MFVPAKCTQCGAKLKVDSAKEAAICQYCGTPFVVEKAINNFNVTNVTNIDTLKAETVNVLDSNSAELIYRTGTTFLNFEEFQEANASFEDMTKKYPFDCRGWIGRVKAISKNYSVFSEDVDSFKKRVDCFVKCCMLKESKSENAKEISAVKDFLLKDGDELLNSLRDKITSAETLTTNNPLSEKREELSQNYLLCEERLEDIESELERAAKKEYFLHIFFSALIFLAVFGLAFLVASPFFNTTIYILIISVISGVFFTLLISKSIYKLIGDTYPEYERDKLKAEKEKDEISRKLADVERKIQEEICKVQEKRQALENDLNKVREYLEKINGQLV